MRSHTVLFCVTVHILALSSCIQPAKVVDFEAVVPIDSIDLIPPINQMYLKSLAEFKESAERLTTSTLAWVEGGEDAKIDAQIAWMNALEDWQVVDMFRLVPFDTYVNPEDTGVEYIYSWPSTNKCRIDMITETQDYLTDDFFEDRLFNVHGLDAIEYLLYGDTSTACPNPEEMDLPALLVETYENWENLAPEDIAVRRAEYAHVLASKVHQASLELESVWTPYINTVLSPENDPPAHDHTEPLTVIVNSLFVLDIRINYTKLVLPLGFSDCSTEDSSESVESNVSRQGGRWLKTNLKTIRSIFMGGDEIGFDDMLTSENEAELHENILNSFQRSIDIAESLDADLQIEILHNRDLVKRLHEEIEVLIGLFNDLRNVWALRKYNTHDPCED